ncbi:hypothetical protein MRB53_029003 [Persea americana]|uniref:Uncharacterized protein n=1 Tax=Persea americana TaxID=3435 RepID=A0ACC2KHP3_PERAE|nr:hypothetical protein MRB53_029003 [Persea americana]
MISSPLSLSCRSSPSLFADRLLSLPDANLLLSLPTQIVSSLSLQVVSEPTGTDLPRSLSPSRATDTASSFHRIPPMTNPPSHANDKV